MLFPLIATVILGALLYKLLTLRQNGHWKKLGIQEIDTSPAVGILDILLGRKTMTEADKYAYEQMGSDKFCGIVEMGTPILLVKDMELMKKVLIKDFDHFVDRRRLFHEEDGSMKQVLFSLEGDEWKGVRVSMSPTFTTGKIRKMMEIFNKVGNEWVDEYKRKALSNDGSVSIDVLSSVNQYTVEVISNAAFGMSAGVIKNPNSDFIKMADRLAEMSKKQVFKFGMKFLFPSLSRVLGLTMFDMDSLHYFEKILGKEMKARLTGGTKRNDWLQLLVEARNGELKATAADELNDFEKDAQITTADTGKKQQYLTDDIMNAQCVVFFLAGYFAASNTITFTLYALAVHKEVQVRLREEVNKIVKGDGSMDYDDVGHLVYMDMVVSEILRVVAGSGRLDRLCVKDYKDPESGLSIPKGTIVGIPVAGIHNDKKYYDNPDKFDPEHFSPEKKNGRNPYAYMPFGVGPRNCIGMRFALTEVKVAIAHMIHSFMIDPTPQTPVPFQGRPAGLQISPPLNLQVKLTPIHTK